MRSTQLRRTLIGQNVILLRSRNISPSLQFRCTSFEAAHDDAKPKPKPTPEPGDAPPITKSRGRVSRTVAVIASILLLSSATYQYISTSSSAHLSILDARKFQPFTITSKTPVSSTSAIFTIQPPTPAPTPSDPYAALWTQGLWSVEFKQPQLQIARSYTPLPARPGAPPGELRFLIRREYKGEVSNYLDRLPVGASIEVRGPEVEYALGKDVSEVVFLAGGTGIAPAMQAVHVLMEEREGEGRKVRILWANRRREDCKGAPKVRGSWWARLWRGAATEVVDERPNALVGEMRELQKRYPGKVEIEYFVDAEGTFIDRARVLDAVRNAEAQDGGKKLIMVSGPEGFIKHFAGAKVWEGGKEVQGPLGGVIKALDLREWEVVKL
jgi:ferredoxin-NADP reductase